MSPIANCYFLASITLYLFHTRFINVSLDIVFPNHKALLSSYMWHSILLFPLICHLWYSIVCMLHVSLDSFVFTRIRTVHSYICPFICFLTLIITYHIELFACYKQYLISLYTLYPIKAFLIWYPNSLANSVAAYNAILETSRVGLVEWIFLQWRDIVFLWKHMSRSKQFRQGAGDTVIFQSSTYIMMGCPNLPRDLIGPLESNSSPGGP